MAVASAALNSGDGGGGIVARLSRYSDLVLAAAVCAVVGMMIVPLPEWLLDLLIILNLSLGLIMLMVALYARDALQFSVFPSLLLLTTLFRLGLDISATRLILLQAHAGQVVTAFGSFVVGGNFVVGVVVFMILIVVNFVVITNGAGRVAEVAARFTLDAMPGKQMAIDAELNAGAINDETARTRRKAVQQEADFYGAMDGASKFVKGDAIAAIIIMVINIAAGFVIGVMQLKMQMGDALSAYTLLTVGEGLTSQIPALLISTATGMIVTRAASEPGSNLAKDVQTQLFGNPRALGIVGVLLLGMAVVPGMPKIPFIVIAGVLFAATQMLRKTSKREALAAANPASAPGGANGQSQEPENFTQLLRVDPISVEIGYGLITLADTESGGNLLTRVTLLRRQIATDLGIVVPTIRIRDDLQLPADTYIVRLRGVEVARGEARANRLLAMNPGTADGSVDIEGLPAIEPAFGLPARWIVPEAREHAESLGYTVVDPTSVITTHLSEVIRHHAAAIINRQDVQSLLDGVKAEHPALVGELVPDTLSIGEIQKVFQHLLVERVSIRDLVTILESLADTARTTRDPDQLGERVRQSLGRAISRQNMGPDDRLAVFTLSPAWQQSLAGALQVTDTGSAILLMDAPSGNKLIQALSKEMERVASLGHNPILLCPARLRLAVKRFTERSLSALTVLSYSEVASQVEVTTLGVVGDAAAI
ncbi:MAG TPA: flagellar biosynthesis protein FlhA [Chloroflexota bacterium]|jgi:flagellar biosynthesis protein FlhA|nr:flagellar biosynthesis protein FlhA [Chloroflexota bacterium]